MIRIQMTENSLHMNGHAQYENKGKDIVCAAVTILWYAITEKLRKENIAIRLQEENGCADIVILEQDEKKRQLAEELMDTMIIGLKSLEEEYPNNIFFEKS